MIKHFLCCVAFCCASLSINAQAEFAPIGAEWIFTPIMENTLNFNPLAQWTSVKSVGDSVIGGQTFRKVGYNLLFFQEDAQVFLFFKDSLYQVLDFGVDVGDLSWLIGESAVHHSDVPSWLRCYRDSTLEFHSERLISLGATDCLDSTTSVRQLYITPITAAPNPITDQFQINLGSEEISLLVVTDITGKTVYRQLGTQTGTVAVECASWPRGVYLCYAQSGGQWLWCKVVK
jgi:hypothetical protein